MPWLPRAPSAAGELATSYRVPPVFTDAEPEVHEFDSALFHRCPRRSGIPVNAATAAPICANDL